MTAVNQQYTSSSRPAPTQLDPIHSTPASP